MNPNTIQSETDSIMPIPNTIQSETDSIMPIPTPPWNRDNTNHWFTNECFSKYWNHYTDARFWYLNHVHYQHAVNSSLCYPPQMASANLQPWDQVRQKNRWRRKKQKRRKKNAARKRSFKPVTMSSNDGQEEEEEEEEFEVEITDAMREFLAKSNERKKQKEILKEKENNSEKEKPCINIEDLADQPLPASHLPPSERPGVRRTNQLKQLYGKKAGSIHGMETALQMEFDRVIDVLQPKLWPNIPLKCIFH